jgi:hypothetical protein
MNDPVIKQLQGIRLHWVLYHISTQTNKHVRKTTNGVKNIVGVTFMFV